MICPNCKLTEARPSNVVGKQTFCGTCFPQVKEKALERKIQHIQYDYKKADKKVRTVKGQVLYSAALRERDSILKKLKIVTNELNTMRGVAPVKVAASLIPSIR